MRCLKLGVAAMAALSITLSGARAQAPDSISFEGFLTDTAGVPIDAAGLGMTFTLYRNSSSIWSEQQSVDVDEGVFSVYLGAVVPLDTVAFNAPLELGIKIDSEPSEMSPRTPLASAPYARALPGFYTYYREDGSNSGYNVVGGPTDNSVGAGVIGATIAGGGGTAESASAPNRVDANFGAVGGGHTNLASGIGAVVPGGEGNEARGRSSLAAGYHARAKHNGSFVWNDRSPASGNDSLLTTAANQFIVGAAGGFGINTAPENQGVHLRQQGLLKQHGLRLETSTQHYWDIFVDSFDDLNFYYNGVCTAWIQDTDGTFVSCYADSPDVRAYGKVLDGVLQLNPSISHVTGRGGLERRTPSLRPDELEAFFPEVVSEKNGVKGVSQKGLTIVTIKAIQELYELVEQQQREIEVLKNQLNGRD